MLIPKLPQHFDDVVNILSILDNRDYKKSKIDVAYVSVGRWIKCAYCDCIYQRNPNRKAGYGSYDKFGKYTEIQKADDLEHWCGAEWQGPPAHDIPAEWVATKKLNTCPDAPYETVEVV